MDSLPDEVVELVGAILVGAEAITIDVLEIVVCEGKVIAELTNEEQSGRQVAIVLLLCLLKEDRQVLLGEGQLLGGQFRLHEGRQGTSRRFRH